MKPMSTTISKKSNLQITIVPSLPDYSKHPTVIKKREEAIEYLKKYGIPESFKKKK
jgi:hypothetical protein